MAKIKIVRKIGGFSIHSIYAPLTKGAYIDSKGDLVYYTKGGKGRKGQGEKVVLKTRQSIQRASREYKKQEPSLSGKKLKSLTPKERKQLKEWGFTPSKIKKINLLQPAKKVVDQAEGANSKNLTFKDILTKINEKGKRVPRTERRPKMSRLHSADSQLDFLKKKINFKDFEERYKLWLDNYRMAVNGKLSSVLPPDVREKILFILDNYELGLEESELPLIDDLYVAFRFDNPALGVTINDLIPQIEKTYDKYLNISKKQE